MTNLSGIKLNKVCRTCLTASEDLQLLYASSGNTEISFAEKLSSLTALKCYESDGFPTQICHSCINILNQLHTFKLKCLESNGILHSALRAATIEKTGNIFTKTPPIYKKTPVYDILSKANIQKYLDTQLKLAKDEINTNSKVHLDNQMKQKLKKQKQLQSRKLARASYMRKTTGDRPYLCTACQQAFKLKSYLVKHIKKHIHMEKLYSCTICAAAFTRKETLNIHIKKHTGEKPYFCTICDATFNQRPNFLVHMQMHTGEKPYSCSFCNSSFYRKSMLTRHMRIHTGEKPYVCAYCGTSFNRKRSLTTHLLAHTGEKPYPCTFCDKSFKQKEYLAIHMRSHIGDKPYSCKLCDCSFIRKMSLTIHNRKHTGERPYTCNVCDKKFRIKYHLTSHLRKHRRNDIYAMYMKQQME